MQIDNHKFNELVEFYKTSFLEHWEDEKYKWVAVKWFQEHFDIEAPDFSAMFKDAIGKTANLLASVNNFPGSQIIDFAKEYKEETRSMFRNLYDETKNLQTRIDEFNQKSIEIVSKHNNANPDNLWGKSFQNENAISTYLWLQFPDKYYIYKYSEYKAVAEELNVQTKFTKGKKENVINGFAMYDEICNRISTDTQIQNLLQGSLTDDCYQDPMLKTLTIDFGFHISRYYKTYLQTHKTKRYWLYAPGENAKFWDEFYDKGIMAIGWEELGDLSNYIEREDLVKALNQLYGEKNRRNDVSCNDDFANKMNIGDVVFVKKGRRKILGYGIVTSDYYYDKNRKYYNSIRDVDWKIKGEWEHPGDAVTKTLTDITPYTQYVEKLKTLFNMQANPYQKYVNLLKSNHNLILTGAPGTGKTYLAKQIAQAMGCTDNEIGFVQFHPSYDYTDFVEGLRPLNDDNENVGFERKDGVFKEFCVKALENFKDSQKSLQTLQQETSVRDLIEDFVQDAIDSDLKLKTQGTKNVFHIIENKAKHIIVDIPKNEKTRVISLSKSDLITLLENKVDISGGKDIQIYFHRKYRTQQDSYTYVLYEKLKGLKSTKKVDSVSLIPKKNFVFIIDEINRGEISKIFGELFFSIDPGYRGEKGKVQTQYQNMIEDGDTFKKGFFVPENVYIIGTMNDIDRSVESMDFAFRRRFAFVEVKANENTGMLDDKEWKVEAIERMNSLNAEIEKIDGLSSAYHIGASYFLKLDNYNGDFDQLWKYHLYGLLREYLRGTQSIDEKMKDLEKAYNLINNTAE